jgi:LysR family transcriptional regulator of gallate degradation
LDLRRHHTSFTICDIYELETGGAPADGLAGTFADDDVSGHLHDSSDDAAGAGKEQAISLRHMRDFMAVAQAGSIARSSASLFKASSAIARSIGKLEQQLGVVLFERHHHGMVLTAYGQALLRRSRRIQGEVNEAIDDIMRSGKHRRAFARTAVQSILFNNRSLHLLVGLADQRSLSAAATSLGISQAGASMSLARMEAVLAQPLFQRMRRGMVATDLGANFVSRGKRILAELRHSRSDVAAIAGATQGSITIGALPLARTHVLPTAIAAVLRSHPNIRITTIESPYEALAVGLRDGDIDFVIGALRSDDTQMDLATECLFEDRLGVIARAEHPLAGRSMSLKDLLRERWILPRSGAPGRSLIEQAFRDLAVEPPMPSVETGDLAVLRGLLMNSDMLTAISPHQLHYELASGTLVELQVGLGSMVRRIGITLRDHAMLSPAALTVLDAIRMVSRNFPASKVD